MTFAHLTGCTGSILVFGSAVPTARGGNGVTPGVIESVRPEGFAGDRPAPAPSGAAGRRLDRAGNPTDWAKSTFRPEPGLCYNFSTYETPYLPRRIGTG